MDHTQQVGALFNFGQDIHFSRLPVGQEGLQGVLQRLESKLGAFSAEKERD